VCYKKVLGQAILCTVMTRSPSEKGQLKANAKKLVGYFTDVREIYVDICLDRGPGLHTR
jgi:hypothetical protein